MPDYATELRKAPLNSAGTGPDRSNADLRWAMIAIGLFRRDMKDTAAQLIIESGKAREKGRDYADMIAETAARFVAQRRSTSFTRLRVTQHSRR